METVGRYPVFFLESGDVGVGRGLLRLIPTSGGVETLSVQVLSRGGWLVVD